MCGIGTEAYQHWVVFGPGVAAASEGEKHCNSGDVVVHAAAWAHCSSSNYKYSMRDGNFYLMHDIVNFINYEKRGRPAQLLKTAFLKVPNIKKESMMPVFTTDMEKIRPHVTIAVDRKPENLMRPFVIPPVLRKLDDDIPLEYLNESRVVCICFIHVKTDEKIDTDEKNFRENMATIVQRAFVKIYQNVTKLQGALSKVIMFDKGLTYLVVFGLPGYINENQSAHALKFAYRTRLALKSIRGVTDCSIGKLRHL
ncbi:Adenylate cyclase type 10 [Orchesella cincta]|uniref:Adenylate cyclase type 10 n=1 Tax=Orchesella cincta TaxID=48709 RepID=A0A1D2NDV2_ORCCI|nr:Adenylate cyclase type 10 [Orchesella cincta]